MESSSVHFNSFAATRKSRRRVAFKSTVTVQSINCRMTPKEKSKTYYRKEELNEFSLEVKELDLRGKSFTRDAVDVEVDPELRGLELDLCPIRVRNMLIARKGVIKYQDKLKANPDKTSEQKLSSLAAASAKLSRWSTLVARHQGRLDSLSVYGGDYLIPINDPVDILPFPFLAKAKARVRVIPHDESDDKDHPPAKKRRRG